MQKVKTKKLFKFELGDKVKDEVNNIKGTVTSRTEYYNGCLRYCVELIQGDDLKEYTFDEQRLTKLPIKKKKPKKKYTGGSRKPIAPFGRCR